MPFTKDGLVLGFDIGTTAVKGVVVTFAGEQVFSQRIACPNHSPRPGWVQQDPQMWIDCIFSIIAEACATVDQHAIQAIGLCSQVNTHVFVDANGNPLREAIIWQDQRCAGIAEELEHRAKDCGLTMHIDSSSLLSRAGWFAHNEASAWQQTSWILSPKDYCIMRLTGEVASDSISSIGLVDQQGNYDKAIISLVDGLESRLPPLRKITDIVGNCNSPNTTLRCPVVVGTMDAWASLYGSGVQGPGEGFQVAGTSEIIALLSREHHSTAGVVTFPPVDNLYLHAGPTQAGGDALSWFAKAMGKRIDEVLSSAEGAAQMEEALLFLPHLMGERAPLWDPEARGVFCGLSKRHSQTNMALAVLEGVAFSARHLLEEIEKAATFQCSSLRLSGGGARSDFWCQVKANAMERVLERVKNIDTGTFGAALMAMVGIGAYDSIHNAAVTAVKIDRVFEPDPATTDWYQALYAIYRETYKQLTPVFSKLSTLQKLS